MRFVALALFFVAAVSCCLADDVEDLIKTAEDKRVPFTETSLKRLKESGLWGTKRANRTTDVVIFNQSRGNFQLRSQDCLVGSFNSGLSPEDEMKTKTSSVYGIDSSEPGQGVQCTIIYQDRETDSYVTIMVNNPFDGDNKVYTTSSSDLKIAPMMVLGNNNQLRITVKNNQRRLRSSSRRASRQNGGGNMVLKASNSGYRYQTL